MRRFAGQAAFVTGASSGVGRSVARALGREGASVVAFGRNRTELEATISSFDELHALAIPGDVRSSEDIHNAMTEARGKFGGIDLVVNAAGVLRLGETTNFSEADWDLTFDTNVKGAFLVSQAAVAEMRKRGKGAVVNVASIFAYAANRGTAAYSASKAAMVAMTKVMALDHIDAGIRINAVAPGSMPTPMLAAASDSDRDALFERIGQLHPTRRLVHPDEVAEVIMFLLSDRARSIVGSVFTIDGGRLAKLGSADG